MLTMTLEQNRSNPRRFVRLVTYRREGDRVVPRMWEEDAEGRLTISELRWRDIASADPDPEFAAAWDAHLRAQLATAA